MELSGGAKGDVHNLNWSVGSGLGGYKFRGLRRVSDRKSIELASLLIMICKVMRQTSAIPAAPPSDNHLYLFNT
jgi:hypothetical protein